MHDYSRDIMLANAQQDMEAGLQKMQLNKKVALTKSNEEKASSLKKQNDELGYMFLPTQVSIEILQGKDPKEMSTKVERAALLMVEIHGVADFCALVSQKRILHKTRSSVLRSIFFKCLALLEICKSHLPDWIFGQVVTCSVCVLCPCVTF